MMILGYGNQIDGAVLSGGSWETDYPLSRIKTRFLREKARSTGTTATITIDVGSSQPMAVFALVGMNLSVSAEVQITNTSGYDSGVLGAYSSGEFGVALSATASRYWTIVITDTNNADGYIEIGRVFIGYKFSPAANIDWSPAFTIESRTGVLEALSGPEFFDVRDNRRVWRGKWSWLTDAEAYGVLMAILRQSDVWQEVYLIEEYSDIDYRDQRQFLGRLRAMDAIEWPHLDTHSCGVEIAEVI